MSYHWDWLFFFRPADDGQLYIEWVLTAWLTTIAMAVGAFVLALLIGTVVGTGRVVSSSIVRLSATIYTEVFRNIPLLVQLFIWYSVLPELVPSTVGVWMKTDMPAWLLATVGLGLYTSARIAEQVRAGLGSIPSGQRSAGKSLGLSSSQIFLNILLPNAFRRIFPTITTEAMNVLKNSSVAFAVGVLELTFEYRQIIEKTSQIFEITIVNLAIYLGSAVTIYALANLFEHRFLEPKAIDRGHVASVTEEGRNAT